METIHIIFGVLVAIILVLVHFYMCLKSFCNRLSEIEEIVGDGGCGVEGFQKMATSNLMHIAKLQMDVEEMKEKEENS